MLLAVVRKLRVGGFFSNLRLPEFFLYYLGFSIASPGVMEFGCEARVNKIHTTLFFCPTDTSVCVDEGSGHCVCIPAWGWDPLPSLPAESGGQTRLRSAETLMRERGCVEAIYGDSSAHSALVKGESLLTAASPWPWVTFLSSPFRRMPKGQRF